MIYIYIYLDRYAQCISFRFAFSQLDSPRWYVEQIYISKVINPGALPVGLSANRKGGVTISIKKRGGWEESFKMSKEIAGWV